MAIAAIPSNFYVQEGNSQVLLSWDIVGGALSYTIQRSTDGVNFATLATPSLNSYLDANVVIGTQYYYKIASTNATGTSGYTEPQSIIPAPTAEMSLGGLRLAAQQKSDLVNSGFLTVPEWNNFINLALYELYDLLITAYEDYFMAPRARFTTNGSQAQYPLPNGILSFNDINNSPMIAAPFYKLLGLDLGLNTSTNAFVTLSKFNLLDRNKFVYPTSTGTLNGLYNLQYRVMGTNIEFIPTPTSSTVIQILYIPRLPKLLQDTDITTIGFSGWLQYAIVRAAKYALDKEESDTSKLDAELIFLKQRIEESASNRDAGRPDTISDVRVNGIGSGGYGSGWGSGFSSGGW